MATFIAQPGRVFSRRQLIEKIWSSNHPSDDRAIDTHIKTLRAKLKSSNPHQDFIVTHRGFGYSFEPRSK
jgi:two-component system catabolic regulation response regulator CreB